MMSREEIIQEIYRSIRDANNPFRFVFREKNSVVLDTRNQKVRVSFRITSEEKESDNE